MLARGLEAVFQFKEAVEAYKAGPHPKPECQGRLPSDYTGAKPLRLYEAIPEAIYASRDKTLSLRVPDDPPARLRAASALAEAVTAALARSSDEVAVDTEVPAGSGWSPNPPHPAAPDDRSPAAPW